MSVAWVEALKGSPEVEGSPGALLAALVSVPPLVPFRLIRRVRRQFLGPGTLYLEEALCESDLVSASSRDGIELEADFRDAARARLREQSLADPDSVLSLREVASCDDLGMSPLLVVEEHLAWEYVTRQNFQLVCDRLLTDCLLTVARQDRMGILDWAAGALRRLPTLVVSTPSGWLLSELCNARGRTTRVITPPPLQDLDRDLLREVLPLFPSTLVGFHRDGETLTLGTITRRRRLAFSVPAIAFRPVTISWRQPVGDGVHALGDEGVGPEVGGSDGPSPDGGTQPRRDDAGADDRASTEPDPGECEQVPRGASDARRVRRTVDVMGQVDPLPVGTSEVVIRNAAGGTLVLQAFEPGATAPETVELDRCLDLLEGAWRESRPVMARVVRSLSPVLVVVRFVEAWSVSALMRLDHEYLEANATHARSGQELPVRICNFDRRWQRILCRPTPPEAWTPGILTEGMDVEGICRNRAKYGLFVTVPITEQGSAGPTLTGLLHESQVAQRWRGSWQRLRNGDPVTVRILTIDPETFRIAFGLPDGGNFPARYPVGMRDTGTIVKIVPFGVFVALSDGFEALLHKSEIAADQEIRLWEAIRVQVLSIDSEKQRVNLAADPRLPSGAPAKAVMPPLDLAYPPDPQVPRAVLTVQMDAVANYVKRRLSTGHQKILMSVLATEVSSAFDDLAAGKWLGYGKFSAMLAALVPEALMEGHWVWMPGPGSDRP